MPKIIKTRWTPKELLQTKFPDLDWIVPNLVPEGFSILGGRPKVGKSWLAMQITKAVLEGGQVFGKTCKPGKVFYLALEDNPRRLSRRMKSQGWESTSNCVITTIWRPLNAGGLEDLEKEFEREQYRLCIIDTTTRAFQIKDHNDLSSMSKAYETVQKFFENHDVSLLAIDHHNKASSGFEFDPIESIIASTAKVAVCDTIIGLARKRGKKNTLLGARGREMEEFSNEIIFDSAIMSWQLKDTVSELRKGIIEQAKRDGVIAVYITDLAKALEKNPAQVQREMNDLVATGYFIQGAKQGTRVPYILKKEESFLE